METVVFNEKEGFAILLDKREDAYLVKSTKETTWIDQNAFNNKYQYVNSIYSLDLPFRLVRYFNGFKKFFGTRFIYEPLEIYKEEIALLLSKYYRKEILNDKTFIQSPIFNLLAYLDSNSNCFEEIVGQIANKNAVLTLNNVKTFPRAKRYYIILLPKEKYKTEEDKFKIENKIEDKLEKNIIDIQFYYVDFKHDCICLDYYRDFYSSR